MQPFLQPQLPRVKRMSSYREQKGRCGEHPRTAFQLLSALLAVVLAIGYRVALVPPLKESTVEVFCRLGNQRTDRQTSAGWIHSSQCSLAKTGQPAVQRRVIRMPRAHPRHGPTQRDVGKLRVGVSRANGLNDRQCVVFERRDLCRQHSQPAAAYPATAQWNRRGAMLHAPADSPVRASTHPHGRVLKFPDGLTPGTNNLGADAFALDSAPA